MLPEISLNILDIAQNSIQAEADLIEISIQISLENHTLTLFIGDNGCGMTEDEVQEVTDPFFTSRSTRRVGLGVPFLKQEAEISGGSFEIESELFVGTKLCAIFNEKNIDCMPLGDISSTIYLLILSNDKIDFLFRYYVDKEGFLLDTREIRNICGSASFSDQTISEFIKSYLVENISEINRGQVF